MGKKEMTALAFQRFPHQQRDYRQRQPDGVVHGVFATSRVTVSGLRSDWNQVLSQRFNHLCGLKLGWDGYRGKPVSFACANFAAQVLERLYTDSLPPPSLVPGSDGTLQIEWHLNRLDVELDVLGPNKVVAYFNDERSGRDVEIELDNDFTVVTSWLDQMKRPTPPVEAIS